MKSIYTPITEDVAKSLTVGDSIKISGYIYTGRDSVLPKIVSLAKKDQLSQKDINLQGAVIFHTAVSPAGVGPTSSNKAEIESSMSELAKAGVKVHLGKGVLKRETVDLLRKYNSVYAVTPPVTALFLNRIKMQKIVAFPEEGMEAFHLLQVKEFPAIVAAAHGKTLYEVEKNKVNSNESK